MHWTRRPAPRRLVLALWAAAVALAAPGLGRLETDNRPEVFFTEGTEGLRSHRALLERFGSDEAVRLTLLSNEGEALALAGRLEERATDVPGVARALGPASLHRATGGTWPPPEGAAAAGPLARGLGLLEPGSASVLCVLEPAAPAPRRETLAALEALLDESPPGVRGLIAGQPVLNHALDESSLEVRDRFFPALVALSALLVLLAVREPRAVLVAMLFVGAVEGILLGAMGRAGVALNLVLVILPPVLFVVALATAVHLLLAWRGARAAGRDAASAVGSAWREKGWAVLFTGVTTLIGFGSLATSRVPPVRELGLWAAAGLALLTLAAFTLLPALVMELKGRAPRPRPTAFERRLAVFGRRAGRSSARHRLRILAAGALLAAAGLAGLPRIELETNALRYLAPTHPARSAIETLEKRGFGSSTVELVLARDRGGWAEPEALARLGELGARLEREPLVLSSASAALIVEQATGVLAGGGPPDEADRLDALDELLLSPAGRSDLAPFLDREARHARLTLFTRTVGFEQLEPLLERVRSAAAASFPDAAITVTGQYPLLQRVQRRLFSTLASSLGLTLLCILVVFRLLLGSNRLTLRAMVPNLLPVLVVLGSMGWLGVPLDLATVMVASVVLGLAVDDTLHTLGHHRELAPRHGAHAAVAGTLERTAPAYVLTGLVLGLGFAACTLSDFAPTARFGALAALGIASAVLLDLSLLPALLAGPDRRSEAAAPLRP